MKHLSLILLLLPMLFVSCGDNELARSADGLWYSKLNMKDDYGIPYTREEFLCMNYEESSEKDGGTFVETVISHVSEDDGDYKITYDVCSTIEGEWEILLGDFITVYDLYSLDIKIDSLKFQPSESADFISELSFFSDIWGLSLEQEGIKEDIRKSAYQQIISDYRRHNYQVKEEEGCFNDFQVNGDVLSYVASNVTMKMLRVKE